MGEASVIGVLAIVAIIAIGMNFHPCICPPAPGFGMWACTSSSPPSPPLWILAAARDYLSSFLLYAMLALAVVAVSSPIPAGQPAVLQSETASSPVFPVLFTTIACGAISGSTPWSPPAPPPSTG
jgi:carbon starvation protein